MRDRIPACVKTHSARIIPLHGIVFLYFTSIVMSQLYMYVCYVLIKYQSVNQY